MSKSSTMSPNNVEAELTVLNTAQIIVGKEEGYGSDATEVTSNTCVSEKPTENKARASSSSETAKPIAGKGETFKCDAEECDNVNPGKRCSGCYVVHYCSQPCQKASWKTHKPDCQPRPDRQPKLPPRTVTRESTGPNPTPANQQTTTSRPLRKKLPPRERRNSSSNNNNNNNRRPSRDAIRNAKALLVSSRDALAPVEEQRQAQHFASDDQSIGVRSKPSVIKVVNDMEEDFETFHEVDDDDALDNNIHNIYINSTSHNSGICSYRSSSASVSGDTTSTRSSNTPNSSNKFIPLTEERIRAHLRDYYEDFDSIFRLGKSSRAAWTSFFDQYFTPDIQWVRSSSNSLTGQELAEHFSKDIVGIRMKLVSINSIQVLTMGLSAIVTFTADQKFVYRGNPNSDRTVITMVLNVVNGREIRIAHEHRCTGLPVPDDVDWD